MPSIHGPDVCTWHRTDLPACPVYGRYWGQSGRGSDMAESTRLTHSRHGEQRAYSITSSERASSVCGTVSVVVRHPLRIRAPPHGVSEICHEVMLSTITQTAMRGPFGVWKQIDWLSSKRRPNAPHVQRGSAAVAETNPPKTANA